MKEDMKETYSKEDIQAIAFNIILFGGNARTLVHESFKEMRQGNFEKADLLLKEADDELLNAHKEQTGLLHYYAKGNDFNMEIILVHAQDHLMTTMTLLETAHELKELYKDNIQIKKELNLI